MSDHAGLFSSSYWAFHRNALLFSFALLIVSLPGVNLDPNQTVVVFQIGHLASRALKWAIALAAIYSFAVYLLEWRQEAYGFYLTEHGLLQGRQQQVGAVVEAIKSQIAAVDDYHQSVLEKLSELNAIVGDRVDRLNLALDQDIKLVAEKSEYDSLVTDFLKDINADIESGISSISEDEPPDVSIIQLLENRSVALRIRQRAREFARKLILFRIKSRVVPNFDEFEDKIKDIVRKFDAGTKSASRVARPLVDYEKSLSSLRKKLVREKRLTTSRVWGFGIIVPTLTFICAMAHFVGSEFFYIFPPITNVIGGP